LFSAILDLSFFQNHPIGAEDCTFSFPILLFRFLPSFLRPNKRIFFPRSGLYCRRTDLKSPPAKPNASRFPIFLLMSFAPHPPSGHLCPRGRVQFSSRALPRAPFCFYYTLLHTFEAPILGLPQLPAKSFPTPKFFGRSAVSLSGTSDLRFQALASRNILHVAILGKQPCCAPYDSDSIRFFKLVSLPFFLRVPIQPAKSLTVLIIVLSLTFPVPLLTSHFFCIFWSLRAIRNARPP